MNIWSRSKQRTESTYSSNIQQFYGGGPYLMLFYARASTDRSRNSVRLKKKISDSVSFSTTTTMAASVSSAKFHTSTLYRASISLFRLNTTFPGTQEKYSTNPCSSYYLSSQFRVPRWRKLWKVAHQPDHPTFSALLKIVWNFPFCLNAWF